MKKAGVLLEFIRPKNIVLGLLLVFTGAFVGTEESILSLPVLLALVSISFAAASTLAFNNFFDRDIDKIVHPDRPLPSGRLSPRRAMYFGTILFAISIVVAFFVNLPYFVLTIAGFCLFILYEQVTKNQGLAGNLTVAITIPLVGIAGGFAAGNPYPACFLVLILFPQILGGEILRDVRDMHGDRLKRKTLPMKYGEKPSLILGSFIIFTTIFVSPVPYVLNISGTWYIAGMVAANILILLGVSLTVKNRRNLVRTTKITKTAIFISIIAFLLSKF